MKVFILAVAIIHAVHFRTALAATQNDATWGLERCSKREPVSSQNGPFTYTYEEETVNNITVYIVDTGITPSHEDFEGRARHGANMVYVFGNIESRLLLSRIIFVLLLLSQFELPCDAQGHGTHVAATIGGATYGICKSCSLVGVKVLTRFGFGSTDAIVRGIDWATDDCLDKNNQDGSKCVMSKFQRLLPRTFSSSLFVDRSDLSLGGGANQETDDAVKRAADAGIAVVVAVRQCHAHFDDKLL